MLFTGGAPRKVLAALALAGLLALPLLWTGMSREQKSRVTALFDQPGPKDVVTADTYQLHQAKQVVALGGVWGSLAAGQAVDDPGAYHLPEARSDFAFCILAERLGLPGAGLVLGLYLVLAWQGLAIAAACREPFGRLAAAGLTTLIAVQAVINTAMTVGLLPVVGLSLPLVSYGGSGLVCNGLLAGLLVNIALRPGFEVSREPFRYAVSPPAAVTAPSAFGQRPLAIGGRPGRPRS
jgi:cell division protein FtsW (lipid II flippase)